jgi:lactate racemase
VRVELAYGRGTLAIDLPPAAHVDVLEKLPIAPLADPARELERALVEPIGAPALETLARGRRDAVIVVSDRTRPVPNALLLRPILAALERAGLPRERIAVLVATGLHRAATPAELDEILGPELARSLHVVQHDARDPSAHARLGISRRGIPMEIDRFYLGRDLRILTGLIEPHLMAGYSGGRKAICPGLASAAAIRVAHGARLLEGRIGPGLLDGNPLHEDFTEIALRAGADFIVNVALDRHRAVAGVFCGELRAAFERGAAFVEAECSASLAAPADLVITSAGGDPLDASFYQAIKGIAAASALVKPGGDILLCASLSEGVGSPSFEQILEGCASPEEFERKLADPAYFAIDQWMVQHLCQAWRRARVWLYTDGLPRARVERLLVQAVDDPREAIERALADAGPRARVAVLPQGPYVLATLRGEKRPLGVGREIPASAAAAW